MSDSNTHSPLDVPYLMVGKGAGAFVGNRHLAAPKGTQLANVMLTVAQKLRRRDRQVRRQHRRLCALRRPARRAPVRSHSGSWSWLAPAGLSAAGPGAVARRRRQERRPRAPCAPCCAPSADVNKPESDGTTALHYAVEADALDLVTQLVRAGANVKAANRYGIAPITLAATNGSVKVLEALLEAGADPNACTAAAASRCS